MESNKAMFLIGDGCVILMDCSGNEARGHEEDLSAIPPLYTVLCTWDGMWLIYASKLYFAATAYCCSTLQIEVAIPEVASQRPHKWIFIWSKWVSLHCLPFTPPSSQLCTGINKPLSAFLLELITPSQREPGKQHKKSSWIREVDQLQQEQRVNCREESIGFKDWDSQRLMGRCCSEGLQNAGLFAQNAHSGTLGNG